MMSLIKLYFLYSVCTFFLYFFCARVQSYGGYMAGNVGSSGSGVFKAAISQSPVSDWHYYGKAMQDSALC